MTIGISGGNARIKDSVSRTEVISVEDYESDLGVIFTTGNYGRTAAITAGTPVQRVIPAKSIVRLQAAGSKFSYGPTSDLSKYASGSGPICMYEYIRNATNEDITIYIDVQTTGTIVSWNVIKKFA